jgi:hypothetical protein
MHRERLAVQALKAHSLQVQAHLLLYKSLKILKYSKKLTLTLL